MIVLLYFFIVIFVFVFIFIFVIVIHNLISSSSSIFRCGLGILCSGIDNKQEGDPRIQILENADVINSLKEFVKNSVDSPKVIFSLTVFRLYLFFICSHLFSIV